MFPIRAAPLSLALLVSLAACASVRHQAVAPVSGARLQDVRLDIRPQPGLDLPPEALLAAEELAGDPFTVRARLIAVDPAVLVEALGQRGGSLFAFAVPRGEALRLEEELLAPDRGAGTDIEELILTLCEGQDGYLSILHQQAYIAGFEVLANERGAIADPRVDVVMDGVLLQLRGERAGAGWALDLELAVARLDRPFAQQSVDLTGGAPVTLQIPSGLLRTLTCRATPAANEAVLVGGRALALDDEGRALAVFLEIDPEDGTSPAAQPR